ncbi:MAG: hypothetical protein IJT95_06880, partial [Abditibacteriota bacterium]|nr:hypothetical protein [Abditibacteriota bacterium]
MKIKVLILTLILAAAAAACLAADTYKLRLNYNTNSRYTYVCEDDFKLLSAVAYNRNLLDQQYDLEVKSALFEKALAKDKNGNIKLKRYADIKEIELND